ncbi:MAG TPA: glycosyltransferase [Gemmatimonadales bacterium]|nr:glycosyltransferase [Gemmatimonadales bacterium]
MLLLNYEFPPLGGGAGVASAALARSLAARGVTVDVVTAAVGAAPECVRWGRRLAVYRVATGRTRLHQASVGDAARYLAAALPLVRRLARRHRYDVAHCFFSLPTGVLLPVGGLGAARTVVSLRGSDVPGYDRANATVERLHRVLRPLTRHLWRRSDRVVTVCRALGELARETWPALRYDVVRNGVDLALFRPPVPPRAPRVDRVHCLAVARLVARKGQADLLRAWTLLERGRFTLELVGRGADEAELRALAAALGIADEVRFTGVLSHRELAERYRAADLFTLVPYDEAFGNVFAEALAAGLPIVGSDVGGIPELVTDGVHGTLLAPGDPAAIAAAIRALADDPGRRAAMAARNRRHAEATLGWDVVTGQYLALYDELLHGRAPRLSPVVPRSVEVP